MPQFSQACSVPEFTEEQLLCIGYASFQQLNWQLKYAAQGNLVGYTPKSWKTYGEEILVEAREGAFTITSKMVRNEAWDPLKRNKKNVDKWLAAFEQVKTQATPDNLEKWKQGILELQQQTLVLAEEERKESEEVEKIMKLSSGGHKVTYTIIGINVLVFLVMVFSGVSLFEPTTDSLIKWGGNFKPYTTGGEWWRLLSNIFVHAGIIHILFNMFALVMIGIYLEPMLGKIRYMAAYLCTGIFASMASIAWHSENIVSVGASGAIFGLYGLFLALLTTRLIPAKTRKAMLQSIGIFVVYNLIYGAKSGVDNAAHAGGLISGFLIGYIYFPTIKKPSVVKSALVSVLVLTITVSLTSFYIKGTKDDTLAYEAHIKQIDQLDEKAVNMLNTLQHSSGNNDNQLFSIIKEKVEPTWKQAKTIIDETKTYTLNDHLKKHRTLTNEYIDLRLQQTDLLERMLHGDTTLYPELKDVSSKTSQKYDEISKL